MEPGCNSSRSTPEEPSTESCREYPTTAPRRISGRNITSRSPAAPHRCYPANSRSRCPPKGSLDIAENGSFQVESDCSVRFNWTLPAQDGQVAEPSPMTMRGFLVNGGKEILAFQTDPGAMVAARFSADTK